MSYFSITFGEYGRRGVYGWRPKFLRWPHGPVRYGCWYAAWAFYLGPIKASRMVMSTDEAAE